MKILIALVLAHLLLLGNMIRKAKAEDPTINSILPGEMNPTNKKGDDDLGTKSRTEKSCPRNQKRYPLMECVKEGTPATIDQNCDQIEPILKCGKKPFKIHCPPEKIARERSRCVYIKRESDQ